MADARKALIIIVDAARRDAADPLLADSSVPALSSAMRPLMIAPSCWTVPSVASLLTGRFPWEHGLRWPLNAPPEPPLTLASMLAADDRRMALITANEMYSPPVLDIEPGVAHFPLRRHSRPVTGLRRTLGMIDYGGAGIVDTIRGLAETGMPDLLVIHLNEAHHPYLPPRSGPLGRGALAHVAGHLRYYFSRRDQVWEFAAHADGEGWRDARRRYEECLAYDIARVEEIVRLYESEGLLDDTLVIVTADHGEHLGEHGLADHQGSLHDELVSVPCAVIGPGVPSGPQPGAQFQHTDIALTICTFLGVPMDGYAPAVEPLDILDSSTWETGHDHAFMEWTPWGDGKFASLQKRNPSYDFAPLRRDITGVRTPHWKYTRGADGSAALYDLLDDPGEDDDVRSAHPEVVQDLEARLAEWCAAVGRPAPGEDPSDDDATGGYSEEDQEAIQQRLADLGYI